MLTRKMFVYRSGRVHDIDYDYSKVPRVVETRVTIGCPEHGDFERLTREFLRGKGCAQCKAKGQRRRFLEEFVKGARKVHGDTYGYDRVGATYPKMTITCRVHGDFEQSKYSHLKGSGCPICHPPFSHQSNLASKWLESLGLPDDPQHRGVALLEGKIRVDGLDSEKNTAYLFYGDNYHGNPKLYPPEMLNSTTGKSFGQLNLERLEKEHRIQEAGFNLVTMWEFDFKNPHGVASDPSSEKNTSDYLEAFIQENTLDI